MINFVSTRKRKSAFFGNTSALKYITFSGGHRGGLSPPPPEARGARPPKNLTERSNSPESTVTIFKRF